jgi:TolA-binding protein
LHNTYFKKRFTTISLTASFLGVLPVAKLSSESKKQKANDISKLVDELLKLNDEKVKSKLPSKITQLESRINYCINRIDEIVYQLYELTEAEIKIIETVK